MTPSLNIFDPNYVKQQTIAFNQQQVVTKNDANLAAYTAKAHDMLLNNIQLQASGRPLLTLEPPPFKLAVDSNGNVVTTSDYVTTPISVVPPTVGVASTQTVKQTDPSQIPPDRLDQVIAALQIIYQELVAIRTKVGA